MVNYYYLIHKPHLKPKTFKPVNNRKRKRNAKKKLIDSINSIKTTSAPNEEKIKHFRGPPGSVLQTIEIYGSSLKLLVPT